MSYLDSAIFRGLDILEHASMYIETQYSDALPRQAAKDHFDTRALLLDIRNRAISHAEQLEAEINQLAHTIALEDVASLLEGEAIFESENDIEWWDMSHSGFEGVTDPALRYLELRSCLVRHPSKTNWIRIKKATS